MRISYFGVKIEEEKHKINRRSPMKGGSTKLRSYH